MKRRNRKWENENKGEKKLKNMKKEKWKKSKGKKSESERIIYKKKGRVTRR